jgi:hypothetical protein
MYGIKEPKGIETDFEKLNNTSLGKHEWQYEKPEALREIYKVSNNKN